MSSLLLGLLAIPKHRLAVADYQVAHSIDVRRVIDSKALYQHNHNQLLNPASLTKLATTAAVLAKWGAAHKFTTKVYYTGARNGTRIEGDLLLVGSGDPFIVSETMWEFAAHIANAGINTINGKIRIDNKLFKTDNRAYASSNNAYDAPITPFGINFNTVAIRITPAMRVGERASVQLFPFALPSVRIIAKGVRTSAKTTRVRAIRSNSKDGKILIRVSGTIAHQREPMLIYRSITNPQRIAAEYVQGFLAARGIKVLNNTVPTSKRTHLYSIKGYPLSYIVKGLNTFSNNYIADMLIKKLGTSKARESNADGLGIQAVRSFLQTKVGIKSNFSLHNGSGLTTKNRFSAAQLTKLLVYVAQDMRLFPDFIAALPANGLEGTMLDRITAHEGMIRVKTGTLTNPHTVAGLAGFYRSQQHGLVAFTIISNGKARKAQPPLATLRKQQDSLLALLATLE
ncbi:MAG: D-alanyl-D-alanine carboxypeptidase/D-alanyl-D-alanine-endopeptidase [Pseudomonadota bacterium]|nr:D-alanyl-D-alanine carboxypeptidase/D-alanyl-D-alanine-endopeptidase [Pseudomonadota bacterium]